MSRFQIDSFKSHSAPSMSAHSDNEVPAAALAQASGLLAWALDGFAAVALILFLAATLLLPIALTVPR